MGLFDLNGGNGNSNPLLQALLSGGNSGPAPQGAMGGLASGLANGFRMAAIVRALQNQKQNPMAPNNPATPDNGPQLGQGILSRLYNGIFGGNSAPYYTANGPSQMPPQGVQMPTIPASAPAAPAAAPPAPMPGAVDNGNFNIPTMPGALMGGNIPNV